MNTIKENSKASFNQQAATYDKDIKSQHARSLYPILLEKLSHIPFQSALDLGCGTGEMLKLILQKDNHKDLCGIDPKKCWLLRSRNFRNKSSYSWETASRSHSRTTLLMLCTATTRFIITLHRKMS